MLSPGPVALARRQLPAPVGEMVQPNGRVVEGVLLRVATAPQRMQMINPVAPPEYGSASELVVFSADPNRTDNRNRPPTKAQPIGLRLLTVRSFW